MLGLLLTLDSAIALVQRGLTSAAAMSAAVRAGHTAIVGPRNVLLSAEAVEAAIDAAVRQAGETGDAAAARLEDRHDGPDGVR